MIRLTDLQCLPVLFVVVCGIAFQSGCRQVHESGPELPWGSLTVDLPKEVVAEAYEFARTNESLLRHVPCYCGCERSGHRSVTDCFVRARDAGGRVTWNDHAMSCKVCVDVVVDAVAMSRQGMTPLQIRASMDRKYLPVFGTSTHERH